MICKYCGRICKNKNSLVQHEIRCKLHENRIICGNPKNPGNKGHKGGNKYTKAKQLGLDPPKMSNETKNKISCVIHLVNNKYWSNKDNHIKRSKIMKDVVRRCPNSYSSSNVNGRIKKVLYNDILLDSSWEYLVAKTLDNFKIKWIRPNNGFNYYWNNSVHLYYPDFYLPNYNLYIEVKGYERERDKEKYKVIDNLIVLKLKEINMIKSNEQILLEILAQGPGSSKPSK